MKVGVVMGFKGITGNYGAVINQISQALMLKQANGDSLEEILDAINRRIKDRHMWLENKWITGDEYDEWYTLLTYWKAKAIIESGNIQNKESISIYLNEAYKCGSSDAAAHLGYLYYTGQIITRKPNKRKAAKYFDKANRKDGQFVEYLLAETLSYGEESDIETLREAADYYKIAIKKKVYGAKKKLVDLYLRIGENLDEAERLIREVGKASGENISDVLDSIKEIRRKR